MDRRNFVRNSACLGASLFIPSLSGCTSLYRRGFFIDDVFRWTPAGLVRDFGFLILGSVFDYLDAHCEKCDKSFRIFNVLRIAMEITSFVACPGCSFGRRIVIAIAEESLSTLAQLAVQTALAIPENDGYFVNLVGESDGMFVNRSNVSYGVNQREPYGLFEKEISAIPDIIHYFTQLNGAKRSTEIFHVWKRNGIITDKIPLQIESSSYRTWSNKVNLGTGLWTVTTENKLGHILDAKVFQINSPPAFLKQVHKTSSK